MRISDWISDVCSSDLPVAIASAVYLGLLVSAVGLFLWLWLLRIVPARIAASVQFLQPIFGISASAAMFGDRMGSFFVAGVVLVLIGVGLSIITRDQKSTRLNSSH